MSEEEKKAIEDLNEINYLLDDVYSTGLIDDREREEYEKTIYIILNLIENRQKEIEELKEYDSREMNNNDKIGLRTYHLKNYYVPKQKIKDKIIQLRKEVMKYNEELNFKMIENTANRIIVLQELLEE